MNILRNFARRSTVLAAFLLAAGACGGDAAPVATGFPCDVKKIIESKCQTCHSDPPKRGAPVHILNYADTQVVAPDDPTKKIWQFMEMFITSGYMPFTGSPTGPLTDAEKATMLAWLKGGPVASTATCP